MNNFPFLRPEIDNLKAYTAHPGGEVDLNLDRLDTNESPYDLPSYVKEKLANFYLEKIETNRYPDGSHYELKRAIASYVNESVASDFNLNNISVGNGSDELIRSVLIATCLNNSGSILVADPTFSMYAILAETLGIKVVKIGRSPLDFSIDLEQAKATINNEKNQIKVIFVVHPNSPTGNALTSAEKDWLRTISPDILVVIDEAYFEYSQDTLAAELNEHPNWIILRTFSKAFRLASLRVGYAIAHPEIITALEKIRLPYNLPTFTQTGALLALNERESILATIPETIKEREKVYLYLTQITNLKVWPSASNFIFVQAKNNEEIASQLKQQGTLIRHTCGGLRITIGTPAENQRTITRISQLFEDNINSN